MAARAKRTFVAECMWIDVFSVAVWAEVERQETSSVMLRTTAVYAFLLSQCPHSMGMGEPWGRQKILYTVCKQNLGSCSPRFFREELLTDVECETILHMANEYYHNLLRFRTNALTILIEINDTRILCVVYHYCCTVHTKKRVKEAKEG